MKIKTYKGYNDSMGIELSGELTRDHFNIETRELKFESDDTLSWQVSLTMNEDVHEQLSPVLPTMDAWRRRKDEPVEVQSKWYASRIFRFKYQGCKTEEAKQRKRDKVEMEALKWIHDNANAKIEKVIVQINEGIQRKVEDATKRYTEQVVRVMSGDNMADDFVKEHLDSQEVNERIYELDLEINRLKDERKEQQAIQQLSRNQSMLKYLEENGWNDEDEDNEGKQKVVIMDSLREKLTEMYKNNEGFSTGKFDTNLSFFL